MSGKNKNEKPDWQKIRAEYLAKRTPYRILAEKYGVSVDSLEYHAYKEKWTSDVEKTQEKIREKLIEKVAEKNARILASEIDPALEATSLIEKLALQALQDEKQFNRHLVQKKVKEGKSEECWVEEQEFDVVDTKRLRDLAQALKISKDLQRLLQGIVSTETEQKLAIERERLEVEKKRAGVGDAEDDDTGIVILPEVQEQGESANQQNIDNGTADAGADETEEDEGKEDE